MFGILEKVRLCINGGEGGGVGKEKSILASTVATVNNNNNKNYSSHISG